MKPRTAVVGAGPMGIEAALYASVHGYDVTLYERGQVGSSLREWGHVMLFSPWSMNVSSLGLSVLGTRAVPPADALVTGREMLELYLEPLARSDALKGRVQERTRVVQIARDRVTKKDLIGDPRRRAFPFRLLLEDPAGHERVAEADVVIDASGVWSTPNYCGNGNIPAPGERRFADRISYRLEDFTAPPTFARYAGTRILAVGGGHSAATTICALQHVLTRAPGTEVIWVTRHVAETPVTPIPDDPLPFRAEVLHKANQLVEDRRGVIYRPGFVVDAIAPGSTRALSVTLRGDQSLHVEDVDYIIANCGFGPDNTLYRELQVHECWATRGLMKLSAALLGENTADCLTQASPDAKKLVSPEPGFFIIGNKSYGRLTNFLLRIGRDQIREIFRLIDAERPEAVGVGA